MGRFAKQRRQYVDGGGSATFQFRRRRFDAEQERLGAQSVYFAGDAGAHLSFNLRQAFTLALVDVGDHLKFGLKTAQF